MILLKVSLEISPLIVKLGKFLLKYFSAEEKFDKEKAACEKIF